MVQPRLKLQTVYKLFRLILQRLNQKFVSLQFYLVLLIFFFSPPKVWLASERTFLNYLRVAVLLSSFALALFNSASPKDYIASAMAMVYAIIGVGMVGYAWAMQERRRRRIMERWGGSHDDIVGPVVIIAAIFVAVAVNFVLRVEAS